MAQRGRGRGAAAWEALAARMEAAERERAARVVGRGRGAALVPAPGVVAADTGAAGDGPGAAGVAGLGAAGHGHAGPLAVAAGNAVGGGAGGAGRGAGAVGGGAGAVDGGAGAVGGGGRAAASATSGNGLGSRLQGNPNHGAKPQTVASRYGVKIDPREFEVYCADEYLTGDPEIDDLYIRLASLYNTYGDKRVVMHEKAADGKASRNDKQKYRKEGGHLMQQIRDLHKALRNHNAKAYPIPKILSNDPSFLSTNDIFTSAQKWSSGLVSWRNELVHWRTRVYIPWRMHNQKQHADVFVYSLPMDVTISSSSGLPFVGPGG